MMRIRFEIYELDEVGKERRVKMSGLAELAE